MKKAETSEISKKGTWLQAIVSFLIPLMLVFSVRWALVEPYVIPSGSMIPTLLVNDHIFVNKFQYGLRWPFSTKWLIKWSGPQRGDVIVFRYPENPQVFYIKRLIGVPGDELQIDSGRVRINGIPLVLNVSEEKGDRGFFYFKETVGKVTHSVRFFDPEPSGTVQVYKIPEGKYFFMGDNRDESSDSRVWGFADESLILGKASAIWLSCEEKLPTMTFVCDPSQLRWNRMFQAIQ